MAGRTRCWAGNWNCRAAGSESAREINASLPATIFAFVVILFFGHWKLEEAKVNNRASENTFSSSRSEIVFVLIAVMEGWHSGRRCAVGAAAGVLLPWMKIRVVRISWVSHPLEGVALCWHANKRKCMKCIPSSGNSGSSKDVANILVVTQLKMLRSNWYVISK